jgi:hypothetical protein
MFEIHNEVLLTEQQQAQKDPSCRSWWTYCPGKIGISTSFFAPAGPKYASCPAHAVGNCLGDCYGEGGKISFSYVNMDKSGSNSCHPYSPCDLQANCIDKDPASARGTRYSCICTTDKNWTGDGTDVPQDCKGTWTEEADGTWTELVSTCPEVKWGMEYACGTEDGLYGPRYGCVGNENGAKTHCACTSLGVISTKYLDGVPRSLSAYRVHCGLCKSGFVFANDAQVVNKMTQTSWQKSLAEEFGTKIDLKAVDGQPGAHYAGLVADKAYKFATRGFKLLLSKVQWIMLMVAVVMWTMAVQSCQNVRSWARIVRILRSHQGARSAVTWIHWIVILLACFSLRGVSGATYSQFKFNLDPAGDHSGLRFWDCCVQLSEIALYDHDETYIADATCTNPGGNTPAAESPTNACNNLDGKWLDFNRQDLVMDFGVAVTVASYDWMTANDEPSRDPIKWMLEGSNDGQTWNVVDNTYAVDAFTASQGRHTWQGPFVITLPCTGLGFSYMKLDGEGSCRVAPGGSEDKTVIGGSRTAETEAVCQEQCSIDTNCAAYSYYDGSSGECYLYSNGVYTHLYLPGNAGFHCWAKTGETPSFPSPTSTPSPDNFLPSLYMVASY